MTVSFLISDTRSMYYGVAFAFAESLLCVSSDLFSSQESIPLSLSRRKPEQNK